MMGEINGPFGSETGTPLRPGNLTYRRYRPLLKKAKLPLFRLYDLRHTAATLRLASGEQVKVVQEMLGHTDVRMTLNTYAHVLPGQQEAGAERAEGLLFGKAAVK